ncbi:arginine/serine-rich protein 1 isoform B [Alligator mississippiensis]|uniref:Arginine/serine-rich protein 1 n=1 Tax=Alligator mississippiensis TaxID=8496 RepID=A0A151MMK1_ALLMI|nr:arginine/serine-rich protein 1 isoform B [Alligator mississippiensis]
MGVTHGAGGSPQDPCGGGLPNGDQSGRGCAAAPSGTETGHSSGTSVKAETVAKSTGTEKVKANKTDEMTDFMDDLTLSSPEGRNSHSSEKDKRELLEIAKANAARVLGTNNIVLPASLRLNTASKETNSGNLKSEDAAESTEPSGRLTEDLLRSGTERATAQRGISFSPNNTMAKPVAQKPASLSVKEITISPGREDDRKGNPYGQWVPIKKEENSFLNFSPKSAPFRAH